MSWHPRMVSMGGIIGMAGAALGAGSVLGLRPEGGWVLGLLAGAAVLVVQTIGVRDVDISTLVRDAAGLLGLAGIAATFAGGRFGWTLPFMWFAISVFAPGGDDLKTQILRWMFEPSDTAVATWTAVVLGVAGVGLYAGWGGRR